MRSRAEQTPCFDEERHCVFGAEIQARRRLHISGAVQDPPSSACPVVGGRRRQPPQAPDDTAKHLGGVYTTGFDREVRLDFIEGLMEPPPAQQLVLWCGEQCLRVDSTQRRLNARLNNKAVSRWPSLRRWTAFSHTVASRSGLGFPPGWWPTDPNTSPSLALGRCCVQRRTCKPPPEAL